MEKTQEELDEIRKKYGFNRRIYQKDLTELVDESGNTISAQPIGTPLPIFTDEVLRIQNKTTEETRIYVPHPEIRDTFSREEIKHLFPEIKGEHREWWIDAMIVAATGGPVDANAYLLGEICTKHYPDDKKILDMYAGYRREFAVFAAQYFKLL